MGHMPGFMGLIFQKQGILNSLWPIVLYLNFYTLHFHVANLQVVMFLKEFILLSNQCMKK